MTKSETPEIWRCSCSVIQASCFIRRSSFELRHSLAMFTSRHIKHSRLLLRHARKYLRYKHDKLSDADRDQIVSEMQTLREALRSRDRQNVHSAAETLDKTLHKLTPVTWESHWRENCEVILVAIVIAVGIRSYFLQPFKIPTGSMQPTLNGIIGHPSTEPKPNILRQIVEFVLLGRNYIDVVSREDDQIFEIVPKKIAFFFTFSRLVCERQNFLVYAPPDTLRQDFNVFPVGFVIAVRLSPEARSTRATRCLSINAATTLLSRTTGMFLSSEQIIFRRFARIRSPDRLFISSDWPVCLATSCASIHHFFTSTEKRPRATASNG